MAQNDICSNSLKVMKLENNNGFNDNTIAKENDTIPTFDESMEECKHVIELLISNQFKEAIVICEKWAKLSLYHSHGKALLLFFKAILTLEPPEIGIAVEACNETLEMCQKYRRSNSIANSVSKYLWKANYDDCTEEEIHAELINAEQLLVIALLTFFSDQNIMSLVKGAFRIRSCHSSYKECKEILNNRTQWKSSISKIHFESGVQLGIGTLNLVFSHLPQRVLKILELIGFSGSRRIGLDLLSKSSNDENGLRYYPSQLIVASYECYMNQVFGVGNSNIKLVEVFVDRGLQLYQNSAWFLWFRGRIFQLKGDIDNAIIVLNNCIEAQNELKQMHNICYWELLWCHAVKCDWDSAAKYASILRQQCKWSPATFAYQEATFLYMKMIEENRPDMKTQVSDLFRLVPKLKVRIAGKTIPPEKYACVNANKYFTQNETLVLPAFELFYIWNIYAILHENENLIKPMVMRINKLIPKYINDRDSVNAIENYLLLVLLKGICLRFQKQYSEAEKCFVEIMKNEKNITNDKFILPMASLELGLTKTGLKDNISAKLWLKKAKKEYSGYLLETIIHFRVHTALQTIKSKEKLDKSNDKNS